MPPAALGLLDDDAAPASASTGAEAEVAEARSLPPRATVLTLALVGSLLLLRLGAVPLLGPDEPRYARVAVEMSRSGDFVTPTLQGQPWLEKPILYYWLAAGAFRVFGETEAAARLPSLFAALLVVGTTGLAAARLYGATAGLYAMFACGTSLIVFAYGRAASMDMLVAAFVTVGVTLLGLRALGIAGRLAVPAGWAALGLGVLAKGPLALVVAALALGGFVAWRRDARAARRLLAPAGLLAFVVVAAPWYVAVLLDQGRHFVDVFVLDHNLRRFTSTVHNHPGPPTYYVGVLLGLLFPWSALVPPALAAGRPRQDARDAFVLSWLALPFLFFSAAGSKLPGYILPCVPPLAILAGRAVALRLRSEGRAPLAWHVGGLLVLLLGLLVAASPAILLMQSDPAWRSTIPLAVWSLVLSLGYWRRVARATRAALDLLRVGAAGLLLLVVLAAPPLLARRESGRDLFIPARGRDVLAWGAWRTAWMAGYFYNDGRVRPASGQDEVLAAARETPVLVLAGPEQRRLLGRIPGFHAVTLAEGPRGNALLRVQAGAAPIAVETR